MSLLIAPCGIDCSQCDAYIATQNDDIVLKQKLADNYIKHFNKEIALKDMECDGCNQEGRHIGFCAHCSIRSCVFEKGYSTCAECTEFPCPKGSFIWTKNSKSKATLDELRKT